MARFRDWPRTLRPASYRGAGFYVDSDEIETGRRLDVHEFPLSDEPYVEDLGRKANIISVTAYVVSDNADAEERALRGACESGGAALLSLPMERLQAHCESCRRSFTKDKLGYVAFDLQFVREGRGAGLMPIGFLSAIVSNLASRVKAASVTSFAGSYRGLRVPSYVLSAAVGDVETVAALADTLASTARLRPNRAGPLAYSAANLYRAAGQLSRSGVSGPTITPLSYVGTMAEEVSSAPLAEALFDLARAAGNATVSGAESLLALDPLLAFNAELVTGPGWRAVIAANSAATGRVVRAGTLFGLAERVAETRYDERSDAIQARADVAELTGFELARLDSGRDHELERALGDVAGRTAEYLSRQVADLAPIVTVEAERRMPSLWWAQRLYGRAERAEELALRNGVKHASFMPGSFEAKSV